MRRRRGVGVPDRLASILAAQVPRVRRCLGLGCLAAGVIHEEIARADLNDLYMHISTGCVYQMPNDQRALVLARGMSDERPDKFAGNGKKSVRRGGS